MLATADQMKEQIRKAAVGETKHGRLRPDGWCQSVVRAPCFNKMTLTVIVLSVVWMYFETENSTEKVITDAPSLYVAMEVFFSVYFLMDWSIRVKALQFSSDLWHGWLFFDTVLLMTFFLDGWGCALAHAILAKEGPLEDPNDPSAFAPWFIRTFLILRALRLARLVKVLHAQSHLTVYSQVIGAALGHVFSMLCFLVSALYAFGILFRSVSMGTAVGEMYFKEVPDAMKTLLFHGVLLDDVALLAETLLTESFLMYISLLSFLLLVTLTLLSCFVAVVTHAVHVVAEVEKERISVTLVQGKLERLVGLVGFGGDDIEDPDSVIIPKRDFMALISMPRVAEALKDLGVDIFGLLDLSDDLYGEDAEEMTLRRFLDLMLQLRSDNNATVRDLVDLRRYMRKVVSSLERHSLEEPRQPQRRAQWDHHMDHD